MINIEAVQFTGYNSYVEINDWMKECGDISALAGENRYETPAMLIHSVKGLLVAFPGDYVCRQNGGVFFVLREE